MKEPNSKQEVDAELPLGKAEDVAFSAELADTDDLEARRRAAEADERAARGGIR